MEHLHFPEAVESTRRSSTVFRRIWTISRDTFVTTAAVLAGASAADAPTPANGVEPTKATPVSASLNAAHVQSLERDLAQYTKPLQEEPHNWCFLRLRGNVLIALGRAEEAWADFNRALEIKEFQHNHSTEILIDRVPLLLQRGEYHLALKDCDTALADTFCAIPRERVLDVRAEVLHRLGRIPEALADKAEAQRLRQEYAAHQKALDEEWKKKYPNWPNSVN